eukprot:365259-Chlamydomonas_euryale.AAC.2
MQRTACFPTTRGRSSRPTAEVRLCVRGVNSGRCAGAGWELVAGVKVWKQVGMLGEGTAPQVAASCAGQWEHWICAWMGGWIDGWFDEWTGEWMNG